MSSNHSHEHEHQHEHEHAHEHGHSHSHEHSHSHSHPHSHAEDKTQTTDENLALLGYMLDHNRHHAEDLHELLHALEADNKKEAAALLSDALNLYNQGNDKLAEALAHIREN